jgi:hypothetical protein
LTKSFPLRPFIHALKGVAIPELNSPSFGGQAACSIFGSADFQFKELSADNRIDILLLLTVDRKSVV